MPYNPDCNLFLRSDVDESFPQWIQESIESFKTRVSEKNFPCTFGVTAMKSDKIIFSAVDLLDLPISEAVSKFEKSLQEYCKSLHKLTDKEKAYHIFAFIVHRDSKKYSSLEKDHLLAKKFLCISQDSTITKESQEDSSLFVFDNEAWFVNASSPHHKNLCSRNLGNALFFVMQPFSASKVLFPTHELLVKNISVIRKRIQKFDGWLPKVFQGDPDNDPGCPISETYFLEDKPCQKIKK